MQVLFLLTQLVFLVAVLGVGIARWRKEFRKSWLDRPVQARPKPVSPRPSRANPAAAAPQVRSAR